MTTKSIEQLRKITEAATRELAAAEEAARKQEREAKEQLERAKRAEERKQRYAKQLLLLQPVKRALHEGGFTKACIQEPADNSRGDLNWGPIIQVLGEQAGSAFELTLTATFSRSSGRWSGGSFTGYALVTGDYGDKHRYPELKDGGFNVEKIVEHFRNRQEGARRKAEAAKQQMTAEQEAQALADRLCKELKLSDSNLVKATYDSGRYDSRGRYISTKQIAPKGRVFVSIGTRTCTPEQAAILVEAVRAVQALEPKEKNRA